MATVPTIPSFTASTVASIASLDQLRQCGNFIGTQQVAVSLKRSTDQTGIVANVATAVAWNVEELDSDGMFSVGNPTRVTVVTRGWYRFHVVLPLPNVATAASTAAYLQVTFGSSNPRGSVGTTCVFGGEYQSHTVSSDDVSLRASGQSPCILYPGDYVEAYVQSSVATSVVHNYHNSGNNDLAGFADGSSCLYCFYTGYGT
jgi:hypothetical protein